MKPTPSADFSPECRLDEHALCKGPCEVRVPSQAPAERPIFTIPCVCPCHRAGDR